MAKSMETVYSLTLRQVREVAQRNRTKNINIRLPGDEKQRFRTQRSCNGGLCLGSEHRETVTVVFTFGAL